MSCWSCWSEWTHSARQRGCVHALATQRRNKCQDTGSRFVGAVPRYRLDWIVLGYSRCQPLALIVRLLVVRVEASSFTDQAAPLAAQIRDAIGTPWCADGRQWRPPLPTQTCGRWFDIRQCAILWVSHRLFRPRNHLPVVRVRPPPHRKSGLHSLRWFVNLGRVI